MKRKKYLTKQDKIVDLIIGFTGIFVLNAAIYFSLNGIFFLVDIVGYGQAGAGGIVEQIINIFVGVLPWAINIGLFLFCVWWRPWIALGALSALGFLVMLSILAGICCAVACLTMISIAWLASALGGY
jgi:hypothetical protein